MVNEPEKAKARKIARARGVESRIMLRVILLGQGMSRPLILRISTGQAIPHELELIIRLSRPAIWTGALRCPRRHGMSIDVVQPRSVLFSNAQQFAERSVLHQVAHVTHVRAHNSPHGSRKIANRPIVVEATGFEPVTPCLQSRCSPTELSPHARPLWTGGGRRDPRPPFHTTTQPQHPAIGDYRSIISTHIGSRPMSYTSSGSSSPLSWLTR